MTVELPTLYQQFIHKSRYARWNEDAGRRETWEETVDRYFNFFKNKLEDKIPKDHTMWDISRKLVLSLDVMPSMRALMTAGKALQRDEMSGYNCSFLTIDSLRAFDECMYVLMCGTGVGYSVERQFVSQLPAVADKLHNTDTTIIVDDSKIGWAKAFKELLSLLWAGQIPKWDMSKVRPAGAKLKVFGGRASGPEPLDRLFKFSVALLKNAEGRKLSSLECHDLVCKIAEVVVVGGVRRSALISLSNVSDDRMRIAKSGAWWENNPQRALANNSACYNEKPEFDVFLKEWMSLHDSRSGERGIFSRVAARAVASKYGKRDPNHDWGCNPCSEIILRPFQTCNLTEIVVRSTDTFEDLELKAEVASFLGTIQASLSNFRYVRSIWKKNIEEEALLGVSMTGIMDNTLTNGKKGKEILAETLDSLRTHVETVNELWARHIGINPATATTCVKPSGTVSQLVDAASGIHPRYSQYYVRRVRMDKKDPLTAFLASKGVPHEEDKMNSSVEVFSFPIKSPVGCTTRDEMGALSQLDLWEIYQDYWCEHKPSITIYYKDSEFLELGQRVYNKFDKISGISFLPHSEHTYEQAPYEEISEEAYHAMVASMPGVLDWDDFANFEKEDNTVAVQELACSSGVCEI
jgi:ribonucleoside-triphosphate reductase (thioredoxin)